MIGNILAILLFFLGTANAQPDTEAKLQGLAKQYGMPVDAVRLRQPTDRLEAEMVDYARQQGAQFKASTTLTVDSNPDEIARQKRIDSLVGRPVTDQGFQSGGLPVQATKTTQSNPYDEIAKQYTDSDFENLSEGPGGILERIAASSVAVALLAAVIVIVRSRRKIFLKLRSVTGLADTPSKRVALLASPVAGCVAVFFFGDHEATAAITATGISAGCLIFALTGIREWILSGTSK